MITSQDIREKGFEKAMFGGYEMGAVDDYLELLADEIDALQRENSALKSKMQILVGKIDEYRSNEGAVNMAILSAQKLSVQIENDARARSAAIISEAEQKAALAIGGIDERIAQEDAKLQAAKITTAKFFETARELCQKQLNNLDTISMAGRAATAAEPVRIQTEAPVFDRDPVAEAAPVSENTQVFMFSKDN